MSRLAISPSPLIVEYQLGIASHREREGLFLLQFWDVFTGIVQLIMKNVPASGISFSREYNLVIAVKVHFKVISY